MPFQAPEEERIHLARIEQTLDRVRRRHIAASVPLTAEVAVIDGRPTFAERPRDGYRPIAEGERWGGDWQTGWFRLHGEVPAAWDGAELQLWLEVGGEGLLYDPEGRAIQGITSGSVFDQWYARTLAPLPGPARAGRAVDVWLEAAANPFFGITPSGRLVPGDDPPPGAADRFGRHHATVGTLRLARTDPAMWALWWDLDVALGVVRALGAGSVRRARMLAALGRCCDAFARSGDDATAARAELAGELARPAEPSATRVRAVGHAHIDTAWLWPIAETIRKTARTFANQLDLIDRYPGYVFGASAAQHYAWIEERHPDLFARIRAAVQAGRWEVQGGMWVEADCNIPSGEALLRQIVHGKNWFRDRFDVVIDNLWLPDVFGYSAALPQILRGCGMTSFLTQKLSCNAYNQFPNHTFHWEGLDGSTVLVHFPPEDTYLGELEPGSLVRGQERFREKAVVGEMLSLFGVGDGGGGPLPRQLERGARLASCEGVPPVRFGDGAGFFRDLAAAAPPLRRWVGELYFELHRGTFTTQARIKRLSRRSEHRLHETEMLWTAALADYPTAELDAAWKNLLLHQFHDIIPGSSINQVHREAEAALLAGLESIDRLHERFAARMPAETGAVALFNPLPHAWRGALCLPASCARAVQDQDGRPVPSQREDDRTISLVEIPAQGWLTLRPAPEAAALPAAMAAPVLENALVRYVFADDGRLLSAFDKRCNRELLRAAGNVLTLYHDRPHAHDAWDIDRFYREQRIEDARLAIRSCTRGPVRQRLVLAGTVGASTVELEVTLADGSPRLDITARIDWRERHRMLRVAFPAAVHAHEAVCDVQFGHVRRPTHENTSWDLARFEVCCHRYADIAQGDFGLALLNDGRYGYSISNNVLDLNLLRSPTFPDPESDLGRHEVTYALLPHPGDHVAGGVDIEAALLNRPPAAFPGRTAGAPELPVRVSGAGIELAAQKRAERSAEVIVRVVERHGRCGIATLHLSRPGRIAPCDMLEWHDGTASEVACEHRIELKPFEIRTVRLLP